MLNFSYLQIWKRKVKICATQSCFNPTNFASIRNNSLIIEIFSMKLAYILFLQICFLTISHSYSNCIVKKIYKDAATESVVETVTPNKIFVNKALSDSDELKFVLLENTSETEKCSSSLPASPFNLNFKNLKDDCFVYIENIKLNSQGLWERNIIPYRNMSRNILFHSLKIHI